MQISEQRVFKKKKQEATEYNNASIFMFLTSRICLGKQ